jgi:PPOX class probable F420-dependent enzyme
MNESQKEVTKDQLVDLMSGTKFAVLTTLFPDGRPHSHMMWFDANDDDLLINTEIGRVKYRHLQHDPRCSIVIFDPINPYQFHEVHGHAHTFTTGPAARAHIDTLAQKYRGTDYGRPILTERVIIAIRPDRLTLRGPTG